ncbi:MAG: hypothetical protein JWO76_3551 [Nocardioides sp.]|nr:hypothetical protein [Nocardioides sp.]
MTRVPLRDPLAPVDAVVTVLLSLFAFLMALFLVVAGVGLATHGSTNVSFAGIGSDSTCTVVDNDGGTVSSYSSSGTGIRPAEGIVGRNRDAQARTASWEVCLTDPTRWEQVAARVEPVGTVLFVLGSLLLIRRVIRIARRAGLFTAPTASRTRQLGWFLLVATVVGPFLAAAGRGVVLAGAVHGLHWYDELTPPHLPYALVVVALGVLTFSRILRTAVPLQEEVDATI